MLSDITNKRFSQTSPNLLKRRSSFSIESKEKDSVKKRQRLSKRTLTYLEVASEIVPGLYIGTNLVAKNKKQLLELGITHILSLDETNNPTLPEGVVTKIFPIPDEENSEIMMFLPDCVRFISDGLNGGRVLVHCTYGNARSACIVVAFLMGKMDMSIEDSSTLVTSKRGIAAPHEEHLNQLRFLNSQFYKITADGTLHDRYLLWAKLEGQLSLLSSRLPTESSQTSLNEQQNSETKSEQTTIEIDSPRVNTHLLMKTLQEEKERHHLTQKELEESKAHLELLLTKTQDWLQSSDQEKGKLLRKYSKAKELVTKYATLEQEVDALRGANKELKDENVDLLDELEKTKQRLLNYKEDMVKDLTTLMEDCEKHEQETESLKKERDNLREYYIEEVEKRDVLIFRKDKAIAEKQAQIDAILARLVREST